MRNLRKYLAVLLVVAMMVAAIVPASAASTFSYEEEAQTLHELGLLNGVGTTGEFDPGLGMALDRQTGVVMLLRLFGLDKEAQSMSSEDATAALKGFIDASKVADWAKKEVAYATDNGLIKGYAEAGGKFSFRATAAFEGKMYGTLILRQLGYDDDQFEYSNAVNAFADACGVDESEFAALTSKKMTRDDLVGMSYAALKAAYTDGTKETVLSRLVDAGIVDAEVAQEKVPDALVVDNGTPTPGATPTTNPNTTIGISSVSFSNEAVASDATKAKVNVVFGTAPAAVVASDFSVVQDVYVGSATTGTRTTSVASSVYNFDVATKTAVLTINKVDAGADAKIVKTFVSYKGGALVAAPDYTVGVKGFAVAVASDNSIEGNVDKGQANVNFLSSTLTATGESATVNSVTIRRLGGADTDIASIKLYNGNTLIGKTTSSNSLSSGTVTIPLTTALKVDPGTPVNLVVKASVATGATTGASVKLGIESMALASGTATGLPIYGALKFVNSKVVGGIVTIAAASDNTPTGTIDAGDWVTVAKVDITAEDQQAVMTSLNFQNAGTADLSIINQIRLVSVSTGNTISESSAGSLSLSSSSTPALSETVSANTTKSYYLKAYLIANNTNNAAGKTVAIQLTSASIHNGTASQTCTVVGIPFTGNTMTIRNSTSVVYSYETTSPEASDIAIPANGFADSSSVHSKMTRNAESAPYLVGVLGVAAGSSNDITINKLNVLVNWTAGSSAVGKLPGIGILDENDTVILSPTVAGATTGLTDLFTGGHTFTLSTPVSVLKGQTKKLRIYAFISGDTDGTAIAANDAFQFKVNTGTNAPTDGVIVGSSGTNYITPDGSTVTFNTMTAKAKGTATISEPTTMPAEAGVIKGQDDVLVYKAKIKANEEPILLTTAGAITLSVKTPASGTVFDDGGKLTITYKGSTSTLDDDGTAAGANRKVTYTPATAFRIDVGETAELNFYVKILGAATAGSFTCGLIDAATGFPTASDTVLGYNSYVGGGASTADIVPSGTYPESKAFTIKQLGTVTVGSHSDTWAAKSLRVQTGANGAGRFNPLFFTVDATSANEDIVITSVPVTLAVTGAGAATDFPTIQVMEKATGNIVGTATVAGADTTVQVSSLVAKGTSKQYVVVITANGTNLTAASRLTASLTSAGTVGYKGNTSSATGTATVGTITTGEISVVDEDGADITAKISNPVSTPSVSDEALLAEVAITANGTANHKAMLKSITFTLVQSSSTSTDKDKFVLKDEDGIVLGTVTGIDFSAGNSTIAFTVDKPAVFTCGTAKKLRVYGKIRANETKELQIAGTAAHISFDGEASNTTTALTIPSVRP